MIIFTDRFIPERFQGYNLGPISLIRPGSRGDAGLIAHEETHQAQFWRLPIVHGILYLLSDAYRLKCEVEAYREQAKHYATDRFPLFASYLASRYSLPVSEAEALRLLHGESIEKGQA